MKRKLAKTYKSYLKAFVLSCLASKDSSGVPSSQLTPHP